MTPLSTPGSDSPNTEKVLYDSPGTFVDGDTGEVIATGRMQIITIESTLNESLGGSSGTMAGYTKKYAAGFRNAFGDNN